MPPSEEARGVDIGVSLILVIRHFDVVPHTVINSPRRHLLALSPSLSVGCPRNNSTLNGMMCKEKMSTLVLLKERKCEVSLQRTRRPLLVASAQKYFLESSVASDLRGSVT